MPRCGSKKSPAMPRASSRPSRSTAIGGYLRSPGGVSRVRVDFRHCAVVFSSGGLRGNSRGIMKRALLRSNHLRLAALAAAMIFVAPAAHAFTYETKNYTDDSGLPK